MRKQGLSLVTGGLGFIGRHLVQALIKDGKPVRVLDKTPDPGWFQSKADVWTGSILDKDLLYNALNGVSVVYHLAAIPHLWSASSDDFYQVNVQGTRTVLEVARQFQIERLVYTSSETILRGWRNTSGDPINESQTLPSLDELPGPYSRSKLMAEISVLEAANHGLPATVVYPTIPIGSGDNNLTPPTRMIRDFLNGRNPAYLECNLNLIPVQAVAAGHIAAVEKGKPAERYILGQENISMSQMLGLVEEHIGKRMPKRKIPYWLAKMTAQSMEIWSSFTGKMPAASVEGVRLAGANMIFDCSKARNELQLKHYSLSKALLETATWLEEQGHLK